MVLNRGGAPTQGGVKKFLGGRGPLDSLQHGKVLNGNAYLPNVTPVLILRRYMLFGLVPEEMRVGVKFPEVLQAKARPASQGFNQGNCLVGMPSPFDHSICASLAFEKSMVHIEFLKVTGCIAERLA